MEIKIKWQYAKGSIDTKDMELICIPARGQRVCGPYEQDAEMAIKDGWNMVIAEIHTGDVESSNALCQEICRRFNEFPKEQKL